MNSAVFLLEKYMFPCWWKNFTGTDCPGCGIQRSLWALSEGHLAESFKLYPPLFPLIVTFSLLLINKFISYPRREAILSVSYIVSAATVLVHFFFKLIF